MGYDDWAPDGLEDFSIPNSGKRICPHCGHHEEELVCDDKGIIQYDRYGATGGTHKCPRFHEPFRPTDKQ